MPKPVEPVLVMVLLTVDIAMSEQAGETYVVISERQTGRRAYAQSPGSAVAPPASSPCSRFVLIVSSVDSSRVRRIT
jgi:hypothetical protein